MKTLLITGIGGDIAQSVARIVRDVRPTWRIIGVDVHSRHAGTLFSSVCETIGYASSPDYLVDMKGIIDRHGVDICLPTSEAELGVLSDLKIDRIGSAALLGICRSAVSVGLDKLATAEFLAGIGVPAPWTCAADASSLPETYPCIYKPRRAAGSKGVAICRGPQEAERLAEQAQAAIFQEYLEPADKEVTCAVFRDKLSRVAVLPMLRQLAGGLTGWAQTIDDPEAVDQCTRLANALDLHGPMNVQMRLTAKGPRIFEINPRISSTVYLRHLIGFQDLRWLLDDDEDIAIDYPLIQPGVIAVRVQGGALLNSPAAGVN